MEPARRRRGGGRPIDAGDTPSDGGSTCDPTAGFGPARPLAELNSDKYENTPRLSPDERTIYIATNRPSPRDLAFDIWTVTHAERSAPCWGSPDGCRLYFSRGTWLSYDMYVAERGR